MLTVISNIPLWVFPLVLLLFTLGLRASKDRRVPVFVIYLLPLLGMLSWRNITLLNPPATIWVIALAAYAAGFVFGQTWQQSRIIGREGRFIHLQGEWMTMAALMTLFFAGFTKGFLSAVLPDAATSTPFLAAFATITSLPAGMFLGRAVATLRARR